MLSTLLPREAVWDLVLSLWRLLVNPHSFINVIRTIPVYRNAMIRLLLHICDVLLMMQQLEVIKLLRTLSQILGLSRGRHANMCIALCTYDLQLCNNFVPVKNEMTTLPQKNLHIKNNIVKSS